MMYSIAKSLLSRLKKAFIFYLNIAVLYSNCIMPAYAQSKDKTDLPVKTNLPSDVPDLTKMQAQKKNRTNEQSSSSQAIGSNAFNYKSGLAENVDPRTGLVTLNLPILNIPGISGLDLNLALTFDPTDLSNPFGIANGWKLNLTYIDFTNGTTLHLANGASYAYQPALNNYSHLQYYNLNNLTVSNQSGILDDGSKRAYQYQVLYLQGQKEYLDSRGRLLEKEDRFKNKISFFYKNSNYLTDITDTYGNNIHFQVNQQGVTTINLPVKKGQPTKQLKYYANSQGSLYQTINANGEKTSVFYQNYNNTPMPNAIIYPNGLQTKISYQSIPITTSSGASSFYVAQTVLHQNAQNNNVIAPVNYNFGGTDLPNFTGYPKYTSASNKDTLLESNDPNFQYQTSVSQGNKKVINLYNSRHLLINQLIQDTTDATHPFTLEKKNFTYIGANTNFPFVANYQMPQQIQTTFYSTVSQNQRVVTETANYDDDGNEIQHAYYSGSTSTKPITITNTSYDYTVSPYGIPCSQNVQSADGTIVATVFTLTADKKNIQKQTVGSATGTNFTCSSPDPSFSPSKQQSFLYDTQGRIKQKMLTWADGQQHPGPSQTKIGYAYTLNKKSLTVTTSLQKSKDAVINTQDIIDITSGSRIVHINGNGYKTSYQYDVLNRLTEVDYPNNTAEKFTYALLSNGSNITLTEPDGYTVLNNADVMGRTISVYDNVGTDGSSLTSPTRMVESDTYDLDTGSLFTETNVLENTTVSHYYDALDREIKTVNADGSTTTIQYNDASQATTPSTTSTVTNSTVTASNEQLATRVDTINNLKQTTNTSIIPGASETSTQKTTTSQASNLLTNYLYYDIGDIQSVTNVNLNQSQTFNPDFVLEILNTQVITDNGKQASATLNYAGNYDILNNNLQKTITYQQFPDWDPKLPNSKTSDLLAYNALGQLSSITNSTGQTATYTYDNNGNLQTETDFVGRVWTFVYDNMNRLIESYYMTKGDNTHYEDKKIDYDNNTGWVKDIYYVSDPSSEISYTYYFDGSLKSTTYANDTTSMQYSYYDYVNNTQTVTDYTGISTTYSYDNLNHLLKAQIDDNNWVEYSYYPSYRLETIQRSNGLTTTYNYDGYGQLTDVINRISDTSIQSAFHYVYDASEKNIIEIDTSSQIDSTADFNNVKKYKYDLLNRLYKSDEYDSTGQNLIQSTSYLFDANSNISNKTITTQTGTYSVKNPQSTILNKSLRKLVTLTNAFSLHLPQRIKHYIYFSIDKERMHVAFHSTAAPNVINTTYTYNTIDQLQTIQSTDPAVQGNGTFVFDNGNSNQDGNMTQDNQGNTYLYNDLNQLISFTDKNGVVTTYNYYADGLRKSKTQNNYTIYYYYDRGLEINEKDSANVWASYLIGAGGERINRTLNGITTYYAQNFKGDTVSITDQNMQSVTSFAYNDYGNVTSPAFNQETTLSINNNPFLYSGEYLDSESGLYYLKARYYQPTLMRFITMDTYGVSNKYAYGDANPIMNTDPTGHVAQWVTSLISGLVGTAVGVIGGFFTGGALSESGLLVSTLISAALEGAAGTASAAVTDGIAVLSGQRISSKQWARDLGIGFATGAISGGVSGGFSENLSTTVTDAENSDLSMTSGESSSSLPLSKTRDQAAFNNEVDKAATELQQRAVYFGENHQLSSATDAILQLIGRTDDENKLVTKISLEVATVNRFGYYKGTDDYLFQISQEDQAKIKVTSLTNFSTVDLKPEVLPRYQAVVKEALDKNIDVYFHDVNGRRFLASTEGRNGFTKAVLKNVVKIDEDAGKGIIVLAGANHYNPALNPLSQSFYDFSKMP